MVASIQSGIEQMMILPLPIDVHLVYLTVTAEEDGAVFFRTDVYGLDRKLNSGFPG